MNFAWITTVIFNVQTGLPHPLESDDNYTNDLILDVII